MNFPRESEPSNKLLWTAEPLQKSWKAADKGMTRILTLKNDGTENCRLFYDVALNRSDETAGYKTEIEA